MTKTFTTLPLRIFLLSHAVSATSAKIIVGRLLQWKEKGTLHALRSSVLPTYRISMNTKDMVFPLHLPHLEAKCFSYLFNYISTLCYFVFEGSEADLFAGSWFPPYTVVRDFLSFIYSAYHKAHLLPLYWSPCVFGYFVPVIIPMMRQDTNLLTSASDVCSPLTGEFWV